MTSDKLAKLRKKQKSKDKAEADKKERGERMHRAATSKEYTAKVVDALTLTKSITLRDTMDDCGNWNHGNRTDCCSLYCGKQGRRKYYEKKTKPTAKKKTIAKPKIPLKKKADEATSCYVRLVEEQTERMEMVLTRYQNDTALRSNLYSVTILFAAFGYDLDGNDNPIMPMYILKDKARPRGTLTGTVMKAKKKADAQLKALADKFPNVAWLGGYSWEAQHRERLGGKKKASLNALENLAVKDGLTSTCQTIYTSDAIESWRKHYILFHAHLVVDLRGTSHKTFRDYCHKIWGTDDNRKRPVPDGILIKPFKKDEYKSIPESLETLAQYPFRNQWKYKFKYSGTDEDGNTDDTVYPDITLEPEILSALVNGLTTLNRKTKIVLNNQWDDK